MFLYLLSLQLAIKQFHLKLHHTCSVCNISLKGNFDLKERIYLYVFISVGNVKYIPTN